MSDIRIPNSNQDDFKVEVPATLLRRTRAGLSVIAKNAFLPTELSLSVASLATGGVLAALQRGVGPQSNNLWWLFYCVLPAIAVGSVVAYFLLKYISVSPPAAIARDLLNGLPNPDQTIPKFIDRLVGAWKLESTTVTSKKNSTEIINFDVTGGRISAAGQMYGEAGSPIGGIVSEICDFQPRTKQFLLIYRLTAHNDDGSQLIGLCILNGILFDTDGLMIKGNWFHLQADPSGIRPWGNAILTHMSDHESQ